MGEGWTVDGGTDTQGVEAQCIPSAPQCSWVLAEDTQGAGGVGALGSPRPGRREAPSPGVSSTRSPRGPAAGGRHRPAWLLPPSAPGSPDPGGVRGAPS